MLKNYLFIMGKIVTNPYEQDDYYEARTNDFENPLKDLNPYVMALHVKRLSK